MEIVKKFIIKFWPILFIFFLWFSFSSPYFLQNKVPFSSTYLVNFFSPWNSYPGFASPVKNNAMPDVITQIYPWKTFTINSFKQGIIPLWNPYAFSGTTQLANYQSAVLSPLNLLFFILPFIDAWSILILLQPLFAGIFMYIFLKTLKISKEGSLIGSLAFMFCGFLVTWMAYGTLGYAIAFLPLALFSIEKFCQTKQFRYLFLLSVTIPLSFFSGHFQISLYFFTFIVFYVLYKYLVTRDLRNLILFLFFLITGLLISTPQLLPSIEAYLQSLRSGIFGKIEAIPWGYLPTFVSPDFLGNPVTRNDWFGHYAEWNAYIGLFPLMLALYAIFRQRTKQVLFFSFMAFLALLFSFQTPFLDFLVFLKIPVLSTSAASRIIVLFSFSVCILAGFGFDSLFASFKEKKNTIFYWLLSFSAIFVFLWLIVLLKLFLPLDKISIAKQNLILPTILFILFTGIILFSVFSKKIVQNKKYYFIFSILLILIISFDLLRFSTKWMPFDSKNLAYPNIPVASEFKKISNYDRVFGNIGGEATIYYKLPNIEGYDAVYIKRYGEFIAAISDGVIKESSRSTVLFPKYGLYSNQTLNLLGVKYFVHKISDGHSVWTYPFWLYPKDFSLIYDDRVYQIYQNQKVFPRAFIANNYSVVSNPQDEINKMFLNNYDLRQNVVLEIDPKVKMENAKGNANISSYEPNKVVINTSTSGNSMLFLSDNYYRGWSAYIDGKATSIYRADFTFRAVVLPKGNHTVTFVYNPDSFKWGIYLATIGVALMILAFIFRNKFILLPKT